MRMILDSMDLAEVGTAVLERCFSKYKECLGFLYHKRKDYARAMRNRGETKTYFKPIIKKDLDITFYFLPSCNGKKDLAKYGAIVTLVGQFRYRGENYYFMLLINDRTDGQVAIYTTHFLQRYVERHLKDDSPLNIDTFIKFIKETDGISFGFVDDGYKTENSCQWATSIGNTCGNVLHPNVLLHRTFINADTITKGKKKEAFDRGFSLKDYVTFDSLGIRKLPRSIVKNYKFTLA